MNIPHSEWQQASGSYAEDDQGRLWRIVGFIDRPAVILDPVKVEGHPWQQADERCRQVRVMGTEHASQFHRLVRADQQGV